MDFTTPTLLGLAILAGSCAVELFMKGFYWTSLAFVAVTGVFIGLREFWKLD